MWFSRQEYWSGVPLPSPMINLDSILKSRDITLPTKVHLVKAMVFPVVVYRCVSWTVKGWVQKNWCFQTVMLKKTLGFPWTRRSNQSFLKDINPEYSLEGLMLKLKLQYFGHLMQKADTPDAWKDWGQEQVVTDDEMLDGIINSMDMSLSKFWVMVKVR